MNINNLNDQELINLYLSGNERAFEIILKRHKNRIYTSIYLFVKDQSVANDLFQEVFIKIVNTIRNGKYNHEGKFVQWALRISYNMCVDRFRRNKRTSFIASTDDFDIFDVIKNPDLNAEERIMKSQVHTKIRSYVDALPEEQREVIVLRHYADMSFKEISALTGVSINTALGRMRYALINLRKMVPAKELVV